MEPQGFSMLPLGIDIGTGGILGALAGYATKKIVKVAVVMVGLFVGLLKLMESRGYIEGVNWGKFTGLAGDAANATANASGEASNMAMSLMNILPFGGSFAVGFALGMKKG